MNKLLILALPAALLAAGGARAQTEAAPAPSPLANPITLFNTVCLGGEVRLSRKVFAVTGYADMPEGAKDALGFAIPPGGKPRARPKALPPSDVPNMTVAVLPEKQVFLLLPAADGKGAASQVCSVVWHGREYAAALEVANKLVPTPEDAPAGSSGIPGLNYTLLQGNGAIVGAAEYGDWTVLRLTPDAATAPEK